MSAQAYGRYQIIREIGRGGMAIVYLAHDPRFKRDVALKVLPYHFTQDETLRARFEREAQTIATLEHPAIVPVYDFGEDHEQPYFVMRHMLGGTLIDRLSAGPLPLEQISRILERIAGALDHAHKAGIVHRDLKPGNILFDQYGFAYLADFGIVHIAEQTGLTGTRMVGTPAYMSPEQAQGARIDGRTDVYTLGLILFEMLSGKPAFESTTPMGVLYKHVHEPPPRLPEDGRDLPPTLDGIVRRALAKLPDARYATAGEMSVEVSNALRTPPPVTPPDSPALPPTGTIKLSQAALAVERHALPAGDEPTVVERPITPFPAQPQSPEARHEVSPAARTPAAARGAGRAVVPLAVAGVLVVACAAIALLLLIAGRDRLAGYVAALTGQEQPGEVEPGGEPPPAGGQNTLAEEIESLWASGYRVTDLTFGDGSWAAILSQGAVLGRQAWATTATFPVDYIEARWAEGYRVTSLAYGNGVWAVIVSQESPYGRQNWLTRATFPGDEINDLWREGYRVTSVAHGNGLWAVVLSQDGPFGRQVWATSETFPRDFIESNWAQDFRVTGLTFGNGLWAVVMSQDAPVGRQVWAVRNEFPGEYIERQEGGGFAVTQLAYGRGAWGVVLSQETPYTHQLLRIRPDY